MVPAPLMEIVAPLVQRTVPAWPQPSHQSWAGLPEGAESSERSDMSSATVSPSTFAAQQD